MMEEDKESSTAQTESEEVAEDEVQGGDEAKEEPAANGGEDGESEAKAEPKTKQSKALNAKFARERREREARAKAEKEAKEAERRAYVKGQLDTLKTNPYTDEPITDELDLEQYKLMAELDSQGKDPIRSFAKAWAEKERAEASRKAEAAKAETSKREEESKRARDEVDELIKAHPGLDTSALAKDEAFQEYASGKYGRWTLREIYESFQAMPKGRDAQEAPRKTRSSPSSLPGGSNEPKSVASMSDEEWLSYRQEKYGH